MINIGEPSNSTTRADGTLYERIGGAEVIAGMVNRFYDRVLSDLELAPYFAGVPMDKLQRMQMEFFCAALDGPVNYAGRTIIKAHHGYQVSLPHFQLFVGHLFEVLREYPLSDDERMDLIGRVNLYADEVTGQPGAF